MQTDIAVIIIYHLGQTSTGGKYMKLEVTNIDSLFTYSEICDIQAKKREEVVSTDQIVVPSLQEKVVLTTGYVVVKSRYVVVNKNVVVHGR